MKNVLFIVIGVMAFGAIIVGLAIAGTPQHARLVRLDNQRIQNLETIQMYISNYWQAKNNLPENIGVLNNPIQNVLIPTDPETGLAFEYVPVSTTTFKLCANFSTEQKDDAARVTYTSIIEGGTGVSSWWHSAGHFCFERTIDPDFLQKQKVPLVP